MASWAPDRRRFGLGMGALALVAPDRASAEPDTAPIATGRDGAGRITAPVLIAGQGPFDFVVDTGANRTVVCEELASALGLADAGLARVHGVAGVELTRLVLLPELGSIQSSPGT